MAEETTLPEPENKTADILRKVAAAIIGLVVIILIVLAAKWIGDRIRERFFPGTVVVNPTPTPTPTLSPYPSGYVTLTPVPSGHPDYNHMPNTGPNDVLYAVIGLMVLGGISTLFLTRKRS